MDGGAGCTGGRTVNGEASASYFPRSMMNTPSSNCGPVRLRRPDIVGRSGERQHWPRQLQRRLRLRQDGRLERIDRCSRTSLGPRLWGRERGPGQSANTRLTIPSIWTRCTADRPSTANSSINTFVVYQPPFFKGQSRIHGTCAGRLDVRVSVHCRSPARRSRLVRPFGDDQEFGAAR